MGARTLLMDRAQPRKLGQEVNQTGRDEVDARAFETDAGLRREPLKW